MEIYINNFYCGFAGKTKARLGTFHKVRVVCPHVARVYITTVIEGVSQLFSIGIDMGSVGTKAVIYNGEMIDKIVIPTGWSPKNAGTEVFNALLKRNNIKKEQVKKIITTGYGRSSLDFADKAVTEITCHAKGAFFLNENIRTVLDIGGQDSKVIALDEAGNVSDFLMNDKCAAGTGRFLQVMATLLEMDVEDFSAINSTVKPQKISSMCTVFAESEIISLLANGVEKESLALGILDSIANRAVSMLKRVGIHSEIGFTGGVSKSKNLVTLIEEKTGLNLYSHPDSQIAGALGAAIIGWNKINLGYIE